MSSLPTEQVLSEDAVRGVVGHLDVEARSLRQGFEDPGVGGVLVSDVLLVVSAALPVPTVGSAGGAPRLEAVLSLVGPEGVDDVPDPQESAGA